MLERVSVPFQTWTGGDVSRSIEVCYFDNASELAAVKHTCVALHGAPGSHRDFKHLLMPAHTASIRLILLNWPGNEFSHDDEHFDHSTKGRAVFLRSFLNVLQLPSVDVLVGHSAGCGSLLQLIADEANVCRVALLLNSSGLRPHSAIRPYSLLRLAAFLWRLSALTRFLMQVYYRNAVGRHLLSRTVKEASHSSEVLDRYDFGAIGRAVERIRRHSPTNKPTVVVAFDGGDPLVERSVSLQLIKAVGINKQQFFVSQMNNSELLIRLQRALIRFPNGPFALEFPSNGHFVHKDQGGVIMAFVSMILNRANPKAQL